MALDAQVLLSILAHESSSADIARSLRATPATYSLALADGGGANQAQVVWSDSRTLAASSESLNPAALIDDRGTVTLTAVKLAYLRNTHASIDLAAASDTFGQTGGSPSSVAVPAGSAMLLAVPTAAGRTAATVTVSGSVGGTYDIVIIGEGSVS